MFTLRRDARAARDRVAAAECPEPAGRTASGGVEFLPQDARDGLRGATPHASCVVARTLHLRGLGRADLQSVEASTSVGNSPEDLSASSTALRSAA